MVAIRLTGIRKVDKSTNIVRKKGDNCIHFFSLNQKLISLLRETV
ncbi:hypothetical protein H1P_810030 [Hyella patelloides LEGE 07179]|uniref:Uncharacterized protein n=1 Tax=Hyella patelloides LEGE 07179 TaxID=945734 RepID=A0A563W4F4_9CYAN|nr:hypothetical protein H1P_810030 [Hyella patelloides LEGE 07179]